MIEKLDIPKFESEAEEAEWWDRHREETAKWFEESVVSGDTTDLLAILQRAHERSRAKGSLSYRRNRVFISHSSQDKQFADLVATQLREHGMDPWIDSANIGAGHDIFERLGDALQTTDMFVFVVSSQALESGWVEREVKFAAKRQIKEKEILILPFTIDETPADALPWFLTFFNVQQVEPDAKGAAEIAKAVRRALKRSARVAPGGAPPQEQFKRDSRIDRLIAGVKFLDREAAASAAIEILKTTHASGRNELFEALLNYQDYPDDHDLLMRVLSVVENCAEFAPWLFNHEKLARMSSNADFSVRSSAAAICMNFAQFAPDRAPVDILIKLSDHDEDWYVQAPANAALKAMARALPAVLQIFFTRLHSASAEERAHAAFALLDIAEKEPEVLDAEDLERALSRLRRISDRDAARYLEKALPKVQHAAHVTGYKYGI